MYNLYGFTIWLKLDSYYMLKEKRWLLFCVGVELLFIVGQLLLTLLNPIYGLMYNHEWYIQLENVE